MKKLLVLLLALLLPFAALAELDEDGDVVVTLTGVEFFFTPPEDAFLLSRESSASEFTALGLSQREFLPWMEAYDIYALLFDGEISWEMQVMAYPVEYGDYSDLEGYGLQRECDSMAYSYRDQGYEVVSCEVYDAPEGHRFVCVQAVYVDDEGVREPLVEYFTVHGGYAVSICLFSYLEEMTEADLALAQAVADSLWIMPCQLSR